MNTYDPHAPSQRESADARECPHGEPDMTPAMLHRRIQLFTMFIELACKYDTAMLMDFAQAKAATVNLIDELAVCRQFMLALALQPEETE